MVKKKTKKAPVIKGRYLIKTKTIDTLKGITSFKEERVDKV